MRRVFVLLLLLIVPTSASAASLPLHKCVKGRFQCGRLSVPLDYGDPAGSKISIAVTREKATGSRIGTLFVNYGGPGADAVATTQHVKQLFKPFRAHFDIVAFDPRGTGASRPGLDCKVNQERLGVYRHPFPTPSTYDRFSSVALASEYATRCAERNARLAPHVSTANVARDMDAVRAALGVDKVTYLGFSYGTFLGATYAALFPQNIRAMVLDGPVDPVTYMNDPLTDLARQNAGFEDALQRYFEACAATSAARRVCKWVGDSTPAAAYDQLVARASAHPLAIRHPRAVKGDRHPVDGDVFEFGISSDLYAKQLWPEITVALNMAARGDGTLIRLIADTDWGRRRNGSYTPDYDRYFMIGAAEQSFPRGVTPYEADGALSVQRYPHFYFNGGYSGFAYGQFTPHDDDAYLGPFTLPDAAPTPLVVSNTHDPATPRDSALGMVTALGRSRLLTMDGDGHTAFGGNSKCIDTFVTLYLSALILPPEGTTCRQNVPFPPKPKKKKHGAKASVSALIATAGTRSLPLAGR